MNRAEMLQLATPQLAHRPWRVGRKVGRTVYAQLGAEPSDEDILIGMFDTRGLAECAVRAHNVQLEQ